VKNTIQTKMIRNHIEIIVLMSLIMIVVQVYANQRIEQAQAEGKRYQEARNFTQKILGELRAVELSVYYLLEDGDQKQRNRLAQSQKMLHRYYEQVKTLLANDGAMWAELQDFLDPVLNNLADLTNQLQRNQSSLTPELKKNVKARLLVGTGDPVTFMDKLERRHAQTVKTLELVTLRSHRVRLLLVLALMGLAIVFGYLRTRAITASLQILIKELHKVSAGKYQTLEGIWANDEIGELVRAYNQMVTTIQGNEAVLQDKNEELTAQGEELAAQNEEILAQQEALQQAVDHLTRHEELLGRLYRFSQTLTQTMEMDRLVELALNGILYETESQVGAFMLYNAATAELETRRMVGLTATQHFGLDDSLAGRVAREKQPLVVGYNEGQLCTQGLRGKMLMASEIYLPLVFRGDLLGVIAVGRIGKNEFFDDEQKMLTSLTAQIAVAVHNAATHLQVQRALEQVKEVDRLKSELINTVSHELRTPLSSILGFAELLLQKSPEAAKAQKYQTMIYQEARRLTGLINDFLDLQRIEDNRFELVKKPVDLAELIRTNVEVYRGQSAKHTLTISVEPNLPPINTDPDRLAQVLGNLLSNAVKYSPAGGLIEVSALRRSAQEVEVTVKDHGLGIPAEALPKLFHPFYRVDNSDRRQIGGTGLGLALCRQTLRTLGGDIWVRSEYQKGSAFIFSLPIA
jgi:signal transduction histidine kinase/methyl-accepting chemotaxis protein